jgi:hypothetical protein
METVWLIVKKDGQASAYTIAEADVEGYVNAYRAKGYEDFTVAKALYSIDNSGVIPQGGR